MSFFSKVHECILRKFILHHVEYVLMGGHAVVFYGVRRTTSHMDILIRPTLENGKRILKAFNDLNLVTDEVSESDFTKDNVFTFGSEPDAVDILTFTKGVTLEDVFDNSVYRKMDASG